MPLARYFFFIGGVLLALIFLVDAGSPKLVVADKTDAASNFPAQRIRSDRKWPDPIVFDTSLPTIVPAAPVVIEASVPGSPITAEISAKARVGDTFAQVRPSDEKKPEAKLPPKRKVVRNYAPRNYAPPRMVVVAQQPRFGFFDTTW